ncbi:hypothetical protein ACJ5NV_05395 [Loktanella agnita]|uniref:hypothetical protein n=1 Tax=Loktanella agnita TaxID=287097 RepID=UPI003988358B
MSGKPIRNALSGTSESVICIAVTISMFVGVLAAPVILPIALIDGYSLYALKAGSAQSLSLVSESFGAQFPHFVGVLAALVTFGAYAAKQLITLRLLGVCSNVLLVAYSVFLGLLPIAILHCALFPINMRRLISEIANYTDVRAGNVIAGELPEFWQRSGGTAAVPAE